MNATPQAISHLAAGGPWWLYALVVAALALHIGGGAVGILSGTATVSVAKGERLHRRFGTIFTVAMLVMAAAALTLAIPLHQRSNIAAGALAGYLVLTGWVTARRKDGEAGWFEKLACVVALGIGGLFLSWGIVAGGNPKGALDGYDASFYFAFAGIGGLFAALDLKVILQGGVSGAARIARHLWRMCFAFFFATGSFFLGQQKVMPAAWHGAAVLYVLGLAPLAIMIFWLVRVRIGNRFKSEAVPV